MLIEGDPLSETQGLAVFHGSLFQQCRYDEEDSRQQRPKSKAKGLQGILGNSNSLGVILAEMMNWEDSYDFCMD